MLDFRVFSWNTLWPMAASAIVAMTALSGAAGAQTFNFMSSGTCGSEACSAYAAITPGNGTLTVVLTDMQANPVSAGDLLSAIKITLSSSAITATLSSQNGALIDVIGNGPGASVAGAPTHWGVGVSGSQIILETAGSFAVGGKPIDMIIGSPGTGGYTNGNSSITNGHFSSYINGTATFVLADAAITKATTMTSIEFGFGTTPDTFLAGVHVKPAPEPASLGLFITSLLGLSLVARRNRCRDRAPLPHSGNRRSGLAPRA